MLIIFERQRSWLGSKISGYGQLEAVAVFFAMSGLPPGSGHQLEGLAWRSGMSALLLKAPRRGPRSGPEGYFGLRGNGMNPSRFGILTLGSDCASITSFDPTIRLRLRM